MVTMLPTVYISDVVCWALLFVKCALALRLDGLYAIGSQMNAFKQQLSRHRAEYLRRWITEESITAFTLRGLGNMLSPPVQATDIPTPAASLSSHFSEIAELGRRNADEMLITCLY